MRRYWVRINNQTMPIVAPDYASCKAEMTRIAGRPLILGRDCIIESKQIS